MIPNELRKICNDLISQNQNRIVFDLLDFYFPFANTLDDINLLGELSAKVSHSEMFLKCAKVMYSYSPSFESRTNLYLAHKKMNQPKEALELIEENLKLRPNDFFLKLNQAFTTTLLGEKQKSYDMMRKLEPSNEDQHKNIRYGLSYEKIESGNLVDGIRDFFTFAKPLGNPNQEWKGEPVESLTVIGYGGFGDEFINIRFMKHLRERGINAVYYTSKNDIAGLFRRNGFAVTNSINTNIPWVNAALLPSILNLTEDDLWDKPYLTPKNRAIPSTKFKVGIKCNGNPYFSQDIYRRIPMDEMLSHIPSECEVYLFDKDRTHKDVINLNNTLTNWEVTLDKIDEMDIIVSSCTSLPHVSAAMGKRTLVLNPIMPYYTWVSTRTDNTTPWYGSHLNTFYQTQMGSWKEPILQMNEVLKNEIESKHISQSIR